MESIDVTLDHETLCILVLDDLRVAVRVLFDVPAESSPSVTSLFRLSNDEELDFSTLSLDNREAVLEACRKEVKQRKQNE